MYLLSLRQGPTVFAVGAGGFFRLFVFLCVEDGSL